MKKARGRKITHKDIMLKYRLLQSLMDSVPDVIYFKDKSGRLILVNKAHAKGLGLAPEQVAGKTDFDIFPRKRARLMAKDDKRVISSGKPIIDKIERSTRADGIDNYVSTTKIPRYDERGRVVGLIGITRDITNRMHLKQLREEREKIEKKIKALEELNKMKSEFISVVSHELRTPLAIIKEAVTIIYDGLKGPVSPGQQELLNTAKDNIGRLKKIIDELLDISRIEKGTLKLNYSLVNLNALIASSMDFFLKSARDKDISFEYKLPKEEVNIFIDPERVNQVIFNLVDNAMKFTEEGGRIELEVRILEDKVRVGVFDTGIGIAREDLGKVFHKFEQVSSEGSSKNKGVGLGLSIVKDLVEKQGGEIWVESRRGVGSRFYFTLPRFYTRSAISQDLRNKINNLLNKSALLYLINLLIINYKEIHTLTRIDNPKLTSDLNFIVEASIEDFRHSSKGKLDIFCNEFQHGERNIIMPNANEEEATQLCEALKTRIGSYFASNRIENVFVNIGIMDFSYRSEFSGARKSANIYIKKIHIGAEKRRFKRIAYSISIDLILDGGEKETTHALDISEGGVCFIVRRKLETDAKVEVKLNFPKAGSFLSAAGRVAWIREIERAGAEGDKQYKIGVEFIGLSPQQNRDISKLIRKIDVLASAKKRNPQGRRG